MEVVKFLVLLALIAISHGEILKSAIPASLEKILLTRSKRDTTKAGFTMAEKQIVLDKHNEFRRVPGASNMQLMFWDNELASIAQGWVNQCKFAHNSARMTAGGVKPGENLYISSAAFSAAASVTSWNDEVSDYTFSSNDCAAEAVCGHYTQVVWATSYKVGCGVKFCPTAESTTINNGYLVACNYLAHGNMVGQKPYTEGTACAACPSGKETCVSGLCSDGGSVTIPPPPPPPAPTNPPPPATTTKSGGVTLLATTSTTLLGCGLVFILGY